MGADVDVEMPISRFPNIHGHHDWKARLSSSHNDPSDNPTLFMGRGRDRNYTKSRFMLHKVNIPISKVKGSSIKLKWSKKNFLSLKWVWKTSSFCVKNKAPAKFTGSYQKRVYARNTMEKLSIWNLNIAFFYQDGSLMKTSSFYYLKILRF